MKVITIRSVLTFLQHECKLSAGFSMWRSQQSSQAGRDLIVSLQLDMLEGLVILKLQAVARVISQEAIQSYQSF